MNLDDPKTIYSCDKSGMLETLESFPDQCLAAKIIGKALKIPAAFNSVYENIICTGLGGSAIGADIARSYISDEAGTPFFVNRNYTLPAFTGSKSLVIVSSYSGDTEETLSAYKDAGAKGAKVIAITSGGELKKRAEGDGFPVIEIPKGLPPRCALGYSFFPLLVLLSKIGILEDKTKEIDETIRILTGLREEKLGHSVPARRNTAKYIAKKLYLKYPVIYGSQDHMDCVATRWRSQLAENSKTMSSCHTFPEMCHNEIVGWENPGWILKKFAIVMLRYSGGHRRTSKRMDIVKKILKKEGVDVTEVLASGKGLLPRMFSLIYTGDFVSFYLAILNRRDPTPVERIAYLKKELAKV